MVISDRWPSTQPFSMDGPKLYSDKSTFLLHILDKIQLKIYRLIPQADLIIFLDPDLNSILRRNRKRKIKEPEDYILMRYESVKKANPKGKQMLIYDNNLELENAVEDCLKKIIIFLNKET